MNVTMLYMLGIKNFVIKVNSIGDTLSRENYKKQKYKKLLQYIFVVFNKISCFESKNIKCQNFRTKLSKND